MLSPYRVLDLTDERGMLAGQILADLGADVIQVEPPGGSPARRLGPWAGGEESPDTSLYWWAYARNKRGITCDLDRPEGQALLRRLAASADFLFESAEPRAMAALGLGYDALAAINPRLVYTAITPFGQEGPKAGYAASDIVLLAAGGPLIMAGERGGAPVRCTVPQAYHHAAGDAAGAAMIAHHERQRSGLGQYIDIAAVQSVAAGTQSLILSHAIGETESQRSAGGLSMGALDVRLIWPASDGFVSLTFIFGTAAGPFTRRLMEWIYEEGMCDETTRDKDWIGYTVELLSGQESPEEYARVKGVVEAFLKTKTKAELLEEAQKRVLLMVPITSIPDVADSPQLAARDYWREVERPDGPGANGATTARFPGPFVRFSRQPIEYRRRAPRLGEHNAEVYGELGLSDAEVEALRAEGVI